jgi:hypothetical protein
MMHGQKNIKLSLAHGDQNVLMITRAGQLRWTRNLNIKEESEDLKFFNSGKRGERRDQCRPKPKWLDSRDINT